MIMGVGLREGLLAVWCGWWAVKRQPVSARGPLPEQFCRSRLVLVAPHASVCPQRVAVSVLWVHSAS